MAFNTQIVPYTSDQSFVSMSIIDMLSVSDHAMVEQAQKTTTTMRQVLEEMREQFEMLSVENTQLQRQVVELASQNRKLQETHKTEVSALQTRCTLAEQAVEAMRNELTEKLRNAENKIAQAIAEKQTAVADAIRIERNAKNSAVLAAQAQLQTQIATLRDAISIIGKDLEDAFTRAEQDYTAEARNPNTTDFTFRKAYGYWGAYGHARTHFKERLQQFKL